MDLAVWLDHVRVINKPQLWYDELIPMELTGAQLKAYDKDLAPVLVMFKDVTIKEADGTATFAPEDLKDGGNGCLLYTSNLSAYFAYDEHIRRLIYTTNAVEGFHRQVRKVTKTKGVFPNDMALMKLIYLAVMNISKKWTQPLQNWALTAGQLRIKFGERMPLAI